MVFAVHSPRSSPTDLHWVRWEDGSGGVRVDHMVTQEVESESDSDFCVHICCEKHLSKSVPVSKGLSLGPLSNPHN